jgi:hypothetical protein
MTFRASGMHVRYDLSIRLGIRLALNLRSDWQCGANHFYRKT